MLLTSSSDDARDFLRYRTAVQLMLFASVSLHFVFRPYEEDVLNNIELWSLALSCCTLYVGLFLFDSGGSDAMKQILSVLIVSMYLVSAAAFLIGLCIFAKKSRKTEWEAAVKSVKVGCAALTARCRRSPEPARVEMTVLPYQVDKLHSNPMRRKARK